MAIRQSKLTQRFFGLSDTEIGFIDGVTAGTRTNGKAIVVDSSGTIDALDIDAPAIGGVNITATAAELNNAADVSARTDVEASSGAQVVAAGIQSVEISNSTTTTMTIADAINHQGIFIVKQTSSGTNGHTLTLTSGTFDGTNNVATFNAVNEALIVYFDSAGDGTIVENVGSVVIS